jgi:polysaccharide export outer membrane protein
MYYEGLRAPASRSSLNLPRTPTLVDKGGLAAFSWILVDGVGKMRLVLALLFVCGFSVVAFAQTLEAGDTLGISVLQDSKLDRQVIIDRAGMIAFPLAGRIKAAGLTPQALENLLRARLKGNYSTDLDITVSLQTAPIKEDEQKPRIFVTGEVKSPGFFLYRPRTSVVQAIALSGGLGIFAAKKRIQVRRRIDGIESVFVFNYTAFEDGTDLEGNIDLRPNDVVIVPERGLFD